MDQNSGNFSLQEAMRLAKTPAGQQLIDMLKHADNSKLQQAVSQFQSGDAEAAKRALSDVLSDPKMQKLIAQMGK